MNIKDKFSDSKRFWLASFLCVSGVVILITSLVLPPLGIISSTVIAPVGELFILAGGILGLDVVTLKMIKGVVQDELKRKDNKEEETK